MHNHNVRCSNCNKAYGDHFGTDCQRDGGGKGFLPVAMERLQGTDLLTRSVELRGAYAMLESASSYLMNSCCSAYAHRDALTILVQAKRAVRKELQGL